LTNSLLAAGEREEALESVKSLEAFVSDFEEELKEKGVDAKALLRELKKAKKLFSRGEAPSYLKVRELKEGGFLKRIKEFWKRLKG